VTALTRVVLDAAAFDVIDTADGRQLRQLLRRVLERGGEVCCAAVTLAEVCRGTAPTRRAEVAVAQDRGGRRVQVVPTEERLAKLVGTILYHTGRGSDRLGGAHVVAVCAAAEHALVITSDPQGIVELATAIPGVRVVARPPNPLSPGP
jgi:hypothetical protein